MSEQKCPKCGERIETSKSGLEMKRHYRNEHPYEFYGKSNSDATLKDF